MQNSTPKPNDNFATPVATLTHELRAASELMRTEEREGVIAALRGFVDFVAAIPGEREDFLLAPVVRGLVAFADLNRGVVDPVMRPAKLKGRRPEPTGRKTIKAYANFGVDVLLSAGVELELACRFMADLLAKSGMPLGIAITTPPWKAVRGWRARLPKLPPGDQERAIIEELRRELPNLPTEPEPLRARLATLVPLLIARIGAARLQEAPSLFPYRGLPKPRGYQTARQPS